jgi:hypothetical protein
MGVRVRPITFDPSPYLAAAELTARAGETMGRGYAALGSGIASGINTAVERHDRKAEIARQETHYQDELLIQRKRLGFERERLGMDRARVEDTNDMVASELLEKAIEGYDAQAKQMLESADDPQSILGSAQFRSLQASKASAMSSRLAIAAKRTKRAGVMPPTEVTVLGGDEPTEAAPRQSHLYKLTDKNTVAGLLEEAKSQLEQASKGAFSVGKEIKRRRAEQNVRTYTTYLGMAQDKEKAAETRRKEGLDKHTAAEANANRLRDARATQMVRDGHLEADDIGKMRPADIDVAWEVYSKDEAARRQRDTAALGRPSIAETEAQAEARARGTAKGTPEKPVDDGKEFRNLRVLQQTAEDTPEFREWQGAQKRADSLRRELDVIYEPADVQAQRDLIKKVEDSIPSLKAKYEATAEHRAYISRRAGGAPTSEAAPAPPESDAEKAVMAEFYALPTDKQDYPAFQKLKKDHGIK